MQMMQNDARGWCWVCFTWLRTCLYSDLSHPFTYPWSTRRFSRSNQICLIGDLLTLLCNAWGWNHLRIGSMVQCAKINTAEVFPTKVKGFFLQPSTNSKRISQIRLPPLLCFLHIWFPSICITKAAKPLSARCSWSSLAVSICILQCLDFLDWPTWMLVWNTHWNTQRLIGNKLQNATTGDMGHVWDENWMKLISWCSASQFTDPRGIEIFKVPGGTW